LLALCLVPIPAHADWAPHPQAAAPVHQRLPNGLDVILEPHARDGLVAIAMSYRVGARDTPPGERGLAHLVEHLAHRTTRHLGPWAPIDTLTSVGADVNALTLDDQTVFLSLVPSRHLTRVLWVESERMAFLAEAITDEAVGVERQILKREWQLRQGDAVGSRLIELETEAIFPPGHPERSFWAPPGEIARLTAGAARRFVRDWYRPDNATLAIVGDFEPGPTMADIRQYLGSIRRPAQATARVPAPAIEFGGKMTVTAVAPVPAAFMVLSYALPAIDATREAELVVLGALLEELLYAELVIRQKWIEKVEVTERRYGSTRLFSIVVEVSPGVRHSVVERSMDAVIEQVKSQPWPLEHLKQRAVVEALSNYQQLVERAELLALRPTEGLVPLELEIERLTMPSSLDVQAAARAVLLRDRRLVLRVSRALKSDRRGSIYEVDGELRPRVRQ
jgi:predicted Zn-dependent peptidase